MYSHRIQLSQTAREFVQATPELSDAATTVLASEDGTTLEYSDDRIQEFLPEFIDETRATSLFENLQPAEAVQVNKVLELELTYGQPATEWGIGSERLTDGLFDVTTYLRRSPSEAVDVLLLSGAAAVDVDRELPSFTNKYEKFGFASRYSFAVFMGAVILDQVSEQRTDRVIGGVSTSAIIQPGIRRVTKVGGDFHGDFRILQSEEYTDGARSPIATEVPFAPASPYILASGYHSVEVSVLQNCLAHIYGSFTAKETTEIMTELHDSIYTFTEQPRSPFVARFADYGDEDFEIDYAISDLNELFDTQPPGYSKNTTVHLDALRSTAGNQTAPLEIISQNDTLILGNKPEIAAHRITLTRAELPGFITSLLVSADKGDGRTASSSLMKVLRAFTEGMTIHDSPA